MRTRGPASEPSRAEVRAGSLPGSASKDIPGLTGLRGVAVTAVVAYHLGWLPGGFLGVDVFFVLSGFLITSLLLRSPPSAARDLVKWWGKRLRRLTPAVAVVVMAVLIAFATMSGVVADAVATLTWWQNWHLIAVGKPYWASGPSPLRHAWSLSIEEQFYALWPLILMLTLRLGRRWSRSRPERVVAIFALTGASVSFLWSFWRAVSGTGTLSRIYFGTDTRIWTLLLGCFVAAVAHGRQLRVTKLWVTAITVTASAVLVVLVIIASPEARWTYTGGLLAAALASVVLVIASTLPGVLADCLSIAPLQWLGSRSYALYLWSWPAQVFFESHLTDSPRALISIATVATAMLLSEVSLRLVEDPLRRRSSWARRPLPRRAAYLSGVVALALLLTFANHSAQPSKAEVVSSEFESLPDPTTTTSTTCPPAPSTTQPDPSTITDEFDPKTVEESTDPTDLSCGNQKQTRVLVVGDSVGRGAANALKRLNDPSLQIWDRTHLGCGMGPPSDQCPDRSKLWPESVAKINPDVVIVFVQPTSDMIPGDEPRFISSEARALRQREMDEATSQLSSRGAQVLWALPAVPLKSALFYCDGRATNSPCDPRWIELWRFDIESSAKRTGVGTVDIQAWINGRGPEHVRTDRPDGLHLSGPALAEHAVWLADRIKDLPTAD